MKQLVIRQLSRYERRTLRMYQESPCFLKKLNQLFSKCSSVKLPFGQRKCHCIVMIGLSMRLDKYNNMNIIHKFEVENLFEKILNKTKPTKCAYQQPLSFFQLSKKQNRVVIKNTAVCIYWPTTKNETAKRKVKSLESILPNRGTF
jgi:hypothetical protein